jgi:hypothetical protein
VFFGPGTDNKEAFDRLVFACDRTGSIEILSEMFSTWLLVIANYYNTATSGKREMCQSKAKQGTADINGQLIYFLTNRSIIFARRRKEEILGPLQQ